MSTPYKDGPATCPKCGAPTQYTASGDTESQGAFGTHRYAKPAPHVEPQRIELAWIAAQQIRAGLRNVGQPMRQIAENALAQLLADHRELAVGVATPGAPPR